MPRLIDLTGQRFGRLTVIRRAEDYISPKGHARAQWLCQCSCGNKTVVIGNDLRRQRTKSCGCYLSESSTDRATKHDKAYSRLYINWKGMKQRCNNPNHKGYKDYGGRGIKVFEDWEEDFQAFYDYVSKLEHFNEDGYTLDRIDNDKGYEPGNIRWATYSEQRMNQRRQKHS